MAMAASPRDAKDKKKKRISKPESISSSPDSKKSKTTTDNKLKLAKILFYQEEAEAADRKAEDDLAQSHQAADELKRVMSEIHRLKSLGSKANKAELEELRIHGTLQFVTLRKLNRLGHFRCKSVRDVTNEAKQKIDQHHLKLQNLLYEVMHLEREITKCLEFKSKDEDINLVSLEEFYKEAPESISRPSVTKDDPHQQTLARLEYELEQRKRLSENFKATEEHKNQLSSEIKTKREYLESLQPKLQTILQATKPVQEYLGMPFDEVREQHMTAGYLPRPLYVLYMQATAYRDACDRDVSASIQGEVDMAKSLEGSTLNLDEEDEESDQEESEKTEKKRRRKDSIGDVLNAKRQKLLTKHPLSVDLTVTCKDGSILYLSFAYLIHLEIVTVTMRFEPSAEIVMEGVTGGDLWSPESLLKCLYPEDYGLETPRASNKYALQKLGMGEFSQYVAEVGRPYLWVQWLCGIQVLSVCDDACRPEAASTTPQISLSAIHMEGTIQRIRKRIRHRGALHRHLASLEKGIVVVDPEYYCLFPAKINSILSLWRRATREDFLECPFTQHLVTQGLGREHDLFFTAAVVNKSAKMDVFCILGPDYPAMAPIFALQLKWSNYKGLLNNDHIRDIEAEVNIHWTELARHNVPEDLLMNQVQRLLMCFDVYLESECELSGNQGSVEFPREKTFARPCLGPNRAKPYKYNGQLGYFSQR